MCFFIEINKQLYFSKVMSKMKNQLIYYLYLRFSCLAPHLTIGVYLQYVEYLIGNKKKPLTKVNGFMTIENKVEELIEDLFTHLVDKHLRFF